MLQNQLCVVNIHIYLSIVYSRLPTKMVIVRGGGGGGDCTETIISYHIYCVYIYQAFWICDQYKIQLNLWVTGDCCMCDVVNMKPIIGSILSFRNWFCCLSRDSSPDWYMQYLYKATWWICCTVSADKSWSLGIYACLGRRRNKWIWSWLPNNNQEVTQASHSDFRMSPRCGNAFGIIGTLYGESTLIHLTKDQ